MTAMSEVVHVETVPPAWVQMASGKGIDIADPRAELVDFNDIAHHLANLCRFTGAVEGFYSVAQHSVLVGLLLPEHLNVYGLLHDAHEAYFGDDSTPNKNLLRLTPELAAAAEHIAALKARWDEAIWEAARLDEPTLEERSLIRQADHVALAIERRDLLAAPADEMTKRAWEWLPPAPDNIEVRPMKSTKAREMYLWCLGKHLWAPLSEAGEA